jgi:hypothetical protein
MIRLRIALLAALLLVLVSPRPLHAEKAKKIRVQVCVLDDEEKFVAGIKVHVSPYDKADPPMQTTTREKCLQFEIEATAAFDIAFWLDGRIVAVQRSFAGFENVTIPVNYKRLSATSKQLLGLVAIQAYTDSLSQRSLPIAPQAIELLNGSEFNKQVYSIAVDHEKISSMTIRKDIMVNVDKIQKKRKE